MDARIARALGANPSVCSRLGWIRELSQLDCIGRGSTSSYPLNSQWTVAALDGDAGSLVRYECRSVSWLHRSAYEFFFEPAGQRCQDLAEQILGLRQDKEVISALLTGHMRLLKYMPFDLIEPTLERVFESVGDETMIIVEQVAHATFRLGESFKKILDELYVTTLEWRCFGDAPNDFHMDDTSSQTLVMTQTTTFASSSSKDRPYHDTSSSKERLRQAIDRLNVLVMSLEQAQAANVLSSSSHAAELEADF